jgi:hypothetical protein
MEAVQFQVNCTVNRSTEDIIDPSSYTDIHFLVTSWSFWWIVTRVEPCNIAMNPLLWNCHGTKNSSRLRSFAISSFFARDWAVTFTAMESWSALVGG